MTPFLKIAQHVEDKLLGDGSHMGSASRPRDESLLMMLKKYKSKLQKFNLFSARRPGCDSERLQIRSFSICFLRVARRNISGDMFFCCGQNGCCGEHCLRTPVTTKNYPAHSMLASSCRNNIVCLPFNCLLPPPPPRTRLAGPAFLLGFVTNRLYPGRRPRCLHNESVHGEVSCFPEGDLHKHSTCI